MSAGFKVGDKVFWGSNGAVEAYVEAMAKLAADWYGPDDTLTRYLFEQRDSFTIGRILFLDDYLVDAAGRERFLRLLDAAAEQLLREDAFSKYGREWIASVIERLRVRISEG